MHKMAAGDYLVDKESYEMKTLRSEWIEIMRDLEGDLPGREAALRFIEGSDIWVHGKPAPFPFVPNLFSTENLKYLEEVCTTIHRILCKIIARYLADEDYRKLFHFAPELEKLILLPAGYSELLPMGRFDIFLDEADGSFKFCEFNTDGSGAMSRDLMISTALEQSATYQEFARKHQVEKFELFDSWVEAFMKSYREFPKACEHPTICVTDFKESGVFSDFNRFIEAFQRNGHNARFVDVREFEFDGEHLRDSNDGTIIHAIYRRAVTSEILQHPGECDALINAVAAGKVCLIGHFRTTVVHSKMVNIVLFDPATKAMLTDEENAFVEAHVPRTYRLRRDNPSCDMNAILADKNAWIIKPEDDYGAHGVYPGVDFDQARWEELVAANLDCGYIAQEFCQPALVDIVLPQVDPAEPMKVEAWQSMPGFYQYNGQLVGFYCREGQEGVIAIDHGGLCVSSFKVVS